MSESFDPYYVWLGIPPEDQPPDHYTLLGVKRYESSDDVISNAAARQMAFVRTLQMGAHAEESQQLLNELANSGGWTDERVTREQLAAQGWEDLGPCPWNSDRILFRKTCLQDEHYRLRVNKYGPPQVLLPPRRNG